MAADIFLKLGDIKGEASDHKHKGEIEVLSWSWGVSNAGTMSYGGGGGEGKANFSDISFTKRTDKASPVLYQKCATGEHIKEATLFNRKAGKEQHEYLVVKLNDLLITSVQTSGASGGEVIMESVSMSFAKVTFEYKAQKDDGSLDAAVIFKYDVKQQKEA